MYKQISFVITAAIMLTAFITIALYTGSQTAHAAIVIEKRHITIAPAAPKSPTWPFCQLRSGHLRGF